MNTLAGDLTRAHAYPVNIEVQPATGERNRLTTAFRLVLALPHMLLVGGPLAIGLSMTWNSGNGMNYDWGTSGGVLGAVAVVCAIIAWFAIVFTGRHPQGLWNLAALYLRWRVRAIAYSALLRDEYPPFGDGVYPATLELRRPTEPRDRITVAFRIILALPQLLAVWALGIVWAFTSVIAWFAILFTGRYPVALYHYAVSVLRWNVRVEAYLLLLCDEYPPFSLE
jgi:hypothetical protein